MPHLSVRSVSAFAAALGCIAPFCAHADVNLFVSPSGKDTWSGALSEANAAGNDGPVQSISRARDLVRVIGKTEPVHVYLRGGVYPVAEAITFTPEDSGTAAAPIAYRAYPGETPILSGGLAVTGWQQEGDLWVADVPEAASLKDFHELWVGGERRTPARAPNAAHEAGDEPPDSDFYHTAGPVKVAGADGKEESSSTAFRFREGELQPWDSLDDAVVVVFHSWATSLLRIKNVDWENHVLEFTGPARWPFCQWQPDQRFYIEHLFEALDSPGEWYLNRKTNKLYYWPVKGEALAGFTATIPQARQLIVLQGDPAAGRFVDHLQFQGLDLRHCEFPIAPEGHSDSQAAFKVDAAFQATGARHSLIEDCRIGNVGSYGIWLRAGSQYMTVRHNELHDLGAGGVRIGEGASPATASEAADHNVVDNNFLHDGGRVWRSAVGVWIGRASYNTVTHNEICDFRYTGVSAGWSWGYAPSSANHNAINYNHIHHIGRSQLNDMGGVYLLGVSPGTDVKNNLIHDVISHPRLYGGWGLYTDEGSTDIVLENNVVYNTRTGGFHQHYGKDNHVVNNIFAFSHTPNIIRTRNEEHNSFFFERNIVYFNNGQLLGSNWQNENYTMDHNTYWDTSGRAVTFKERSFTEWQAAGHDLHSIIANPLFANAEAADFTLPPDSPALAAGFQPIDLSAVGLYGDAAWVNQPKAIARPPFVPPLPKTPELVSVEKIWDQGGYIGTSPPPYTDWTWSNTGVRLGGPNFIRLPDGSLWAGFRNYVGEASTVLAYMTKTNLEPVLTLPSGGDTSYPGFLWHDDLLWMTYYSSHEGKTSIYLAKIKFD